jgi:hypothetical protein
MTTDQHTALNIPSNAGGITEKFIELCVKSSEFTHSLGELEVNTSDSDGCVFEKIREKYENTRAAVLPPRFRSGGPSEPFS